jgi:hypothetical protein
MKREGPPASLSNLGRADNPGREFLKKMARSQPYVKQISQPQVAHKAKSSVAIGNIASLFLLGVDESIQEDDIRYVHMLHNNYGRGFFVQFGEIKSVVMVPKSKCAFVNFSTRDAAEAAASETFERCVIKDKPLRVQWAKPKASVSGSASD